MNYVEFKEVCLDIKREVKTMRNDRTCMKSWLKFYPSHLNFIQVRLGVLDQIVNDEKSERILFSLPMLVIKDELKKFHHNLELLQSAIGYEGYYISICDLLDAIIDIILSNYRKLYFFCF